MKKCDSSSQRKEKDAKKNSTSFFKNKLSFVEGAANVKADELEKTYIRLEGT